MLGKEVNAEMMVAIDSNIETLLESLSDEEIADLEDDIEEGVVPEDVTCIAYDGIGQTKVIYFFSQKP